MSYAFGLYNIYDPKKHYIADHMVMVEYNTDETLNSPKTALDSS